MDFPLIGLLVCSLYFFSASILVGSFIIILRPAFIPFWTWHGFFPSITRAPVAALIVASRWCHRLQANRKGLFGASVGSIRNTVGAVLIPNRSGLGKLELHQVAVGISVSETVTWQTPLSSSKFCLRIQGKELGGFTTFFQIVGISGFMICGETSKWLQLWEVESKAKAFGGEELFI